MSRLNLRHIGPKYIVFKNGPKIDLHFYDNFDKCGTSVKVSWEYCADFTEILFPTVQKF